MAPASDYDVVSLVPHPMLTMVDQSAFHTSKSKSARWITVGLLCHSSYLSVQSEVIPTHLLSSSGSEAFPLFYVLLSIEHQTVGGRKVRPDSSFTTWWNFKHHGINAKTVCNQSMMHGTITNQQCSISRVCWGILKLFHTYFQVLSKDSEDLTFFPSSDVLFIMSTHVSILEKEKLSFQPRYSCKFSTVKYHTAPTQPVMSHRCLRYSHHW